MTQSLRGIDSSHILHCDDNTTHIRCTMYVSHFITPPAPHFIFAPGVLTHLSPGFGYNIWIWTVVEINLAVICASIPTLRPFVRRYLPSLGFKRSSNQSRYTTQASEWPGTPSAIRMSHVSGAHRPPIQLHQVIPPVGPKSPLARSASNSTGYSWDASKRWTDNSAYIP